MLTSCNKKQVEALPTVPVLSDIRSEEVEMTTIKTLYGKDVTYNKNTKNIVALSNTGDLLALGVRPLAVSNNASSGYTKFKGLIVNKKNIENEDEIVSKAAKEMNANVFFTLPRDKIVQEAEKLNQTVVEAFNTSEISDLYMDLARKISNEE